MVGARAGDGGNLGQRGVCFAHGRGRIAVRGFDQPGAHAFIVFEQRLQQMLRRDPLMVDPDRNGMRRLEKALGAVCEFFEVHSFPFLSHPM